MLAVAPRIFKLNHESTVVLQYLYADSSLKNLYFES